MWRAQKVMNLLLRRHFAHIPLGQVGINLPRTHSTAHSTAHTLTHPTPASSGSDASQLG